MMRIAVLLAGAWALALSSCTPFGLKGDDCRDGPCAPGFVCNDDAVCDDPPPPPPPPCTVELDCALDGDASGRVCEDGVCGFAACTIDAQCGTRLCIGGTCAPRVTCLNDGQCDDGALCVDNACRPACVADADCGVSLGGFGLNTCVDGRCLARCLNDATCIGGGICEGNICITEQCQQPADCDGDNVLCTAGRCETFTPCASDEGCFDANLRCDLEGDPVRCVERPLCRNDAACGIDGICLDDHCRPVDGCFDDADCSDLDDECVGGRCVRQPACRSEVDCDAGQRCVNLRCVDAPAPVAASATRVGDAVGLCAIGGCQRVLFVGESLTMNAQAYDEAGAPLDTTMTARSDNTAVIDVDAFANQATLRALTAGHTNVLMGDVVVDIVVVEPADADELVVVVVDSDGGAVAGANVVIDGVVIVANDDGVVRLPGVPVQPSIAARASDGRGVVLVGEAPLLGSWRLPLPPAASPAGVPVVAVTVTSTGDETGAVGLGLIVPTVSSPGELSMARLLGEVVNAAITVPVIGELPVALPETMSLEATLPLVGQQIIRARAEAVVAEGPSFVLALEDRAEQNTVINLALGGDPVDFALTLLGNSETVDATIVSTGVQTRAALVADRDDRDGDGNVNELVPPFAAAAVVDVRPSQSPLERSAVLAVLPDGATDGLILAGFTVPGALVPAGATIVRQLVNFEGVPLAESFKAVAAPVGLARAGRWVAVVAAFDDDSLASRAMVRSRALPTSATFGALLAPPTGARLVDDLPGPGDRTVLLPDTDGDLIRLHGRDDDGAIDVITSPGSSRQLPGGFFAGSVRLERTDVFVVGGVSRLQAGPGPLSLDEVADKAAAAPAGL